MVETINNSVREEVLKVVEEGNLSAKLQEVKAKLEELRGNISDKNSSEYKYYLSLRIALNLLHDKEDSVILDRIRQDRFPSIINYKFESFNVTLKFENLFSIKTDAYVNTINKEKLFDNPPPNSAIEAFNERVGIEEINKQIKKQTRLGMKTHLTLNHLHLNAPISYHIPLSSESELKKDEIKIGVKKVINKAVKNDDEELAFIALGFDIVNTFSKDDRDDEAEALASCIVTTLYDLSIKINEKFPKIIFSFVSYRTMSVFDRIFYRYQKLNKDEFINLQIIQEKENEVIRNLTTTDEVYIKEIKKNLHMLFKAKPILILGETGVGKTYIAKQIIEGFSGYEKKFIDLNCAMLRPENLYIELFGAKKGTYTSSVADVTGAVEKADGGILFLDEIGYTDITVQRMLLKFIDTGKYKRFGDPDERSAEVKLIFGTNVDLERNIIEKKFQHDLYERMTGAIIKIPPLRERRNDIRLLINHFIDDYNKKNGCDIKIDEKSIKEMQQMPWPGNVRQLKYYIQNLLEWCATYEKTKINIDKIDVDIPRSYLFQVEDDHKKLESLLYNILEKWDPDKGDMKTQLIEPILAKIYVDDFKYKYNKKEASKYIGMDGSSGIKSKLKSAQKLYLKNVKKNNHS